MPVILLHGRWSGWGFPLEQGDGMIEPIKVKAIAEWVDGVQIVGEFGFATFEEIKQVSQAINLDAVQVGMFISLDDISELENLTVIKEVIAGTELPATEMKDHLDAYADHCDFFLLNFSSAGHTWNEVANGHPYPIDFLKNLCQQHRIILHLDCPVEDVPRMIAEIKPYAMSLSGGEEEQVGVKSFDDLDEILDILEVE